jgi:hypothetical protein
MRCRYCPAEATGTLITYFHDGGVMGLTPCCDEHGAAEHNPDPFEGGDIDFDGDRPAAFARGEHWADPRDTTRNRHRVPLEMQNRFFWLAPQHI